MLVVNPRFRYTITEVLNHPWMQIPDHNSFDNTNNNLTAEEDSSKTVPAERVDK